MSRIAGVISQRGEDKLTRLAYKMLAQLPGNNQKATGFPTACFGAASTDVAEIYCTNGILCTIDGWLFNARDLSETLASKPQPNQTALVAALFQKYGFKEMLRKVNGEFAIAIFDLKENTLWLGRDRFGVKPLYYSSIRGGLAFASQPWALIVHPEVTSEVNARFTASYAALHYRTFDNRPEESPYKDIGQLPAGSLLVYRGTTPSVQRYWCLESKSDFRDSEEKLASQFRELLLDSVKLRTETVTRTAFTLSGGLDSSSITSCAYKNSKQPQTAYSAVYEDKTYDESTEIQPMLDKIVSDWHPIEIGNDVDLFSEVTDLVQQHNEPVATATWLSHKRICEAAARDGQKMLFGGLGGDELNAGEYEYFIFHFADLARQGQTHELQGQLETWASHHNHPLYPKTPAIGLHEIGRLTDEHPGVCIPDHLRLERYIHTLDINYYGDELKNVRMDHPFDSCLKNRTYQDIFFETLPCCLRAEDRNATAAGLSQTNPFLDHRLVEFMFRVDGRHKIKSGVTKVLLRKAMKGILPEETRTRVNKVGWNAPAHRWFSGRQLECLRDTVASIEFSNLGIYNVAAVLKVIENHIDILNDTTPRENHMMFLWQLLNTHIWIRATKTIKQGIKS